MPEPLYIAKGEKEIHLLPGKVAQKTEEVRETPPAARKSEKDVQGKLLDAFAKSAAHAIGSQVGRQIIRGVLGSIFGGRKR